MSNELQEYRLECMLIARDDLERWGYYNNPVLNEKIEYALSSRKASLITKLKWRLLRVIRT